MNLSFILQYTPGNLFEIESILNKIEWRWEGVIQSIDEMDSLTYLYLSKK